MVSTRQKLFRYLLPATNLIFGKGSLGCVGTEAKKLGKKALVVTGKKSMERLSFLQKSIDFLEKEGPEVVHYGEVNQNPPIDVVDRDAEKAIDSHCDVAVGFGGGSSYRYSKEYCCCCRAF